MLSRNPEVQAKLQEEVDQAFEEAEGEFPDYTVVQGLPYLDMVVHETLRLHSPAPTTARYCTHLCIIINHRLPPSTTMSSIPRSCTQDYTIPGTSITLKRNDSVMFSGKGLHRDPQ